MQKKKKRFNYFIIFIFFLLYLLGIVWCLIYQPKLKTIVISSTKEPSASVIFLHGLGDTARNQKKFLAPLAGKYPYIKFIIPQAPITFVSMNYWLPMPAWYNIKGSINDIMALKESKKGLRRSLTKIKKIIRAEINAGVPAKRILIIGHSQGGATALATGLISEHQLAGVIGLGTYLPCREEIFKWASEVSKQIPFSLYHDDWDQIIPFDVGQKTANALVERGYRVEFEDVFIGGHFFSAEEFERIVSRKLNELLPPLQ